MTVTIIHAPNCVSIPSRRVGDAYLIKAGLAWQLQFPSPQGGSETSRSLYLLALSLLVSIPSRRVGDKYRSNTQRAIVDVSIPSRRVGDRTRPVPSRPANLVSIPSRRVGDCAIGHL